jgi:hypothetical protein
MTSRPRSRRLPARPDLRIAAAIVALAGCGQAASPPAIPEPRLASPAHELAITFEQGPCFGDCPVYKVEIYRDGTVVFHGDSAVKVQGEAVGHVTSEQLAALQRAFARVQFFALADDYSHSDRLDQDFVVVTYQIGGRSKRIHHYRGDRRGRVLLPLEGEILETVNVDQWIGTK